MPHGCPRAKNVILPQHQWHHCVGVKWWRQRWEAADEAGQLTLHTHRPASEKWLMTIWPSMNSGLCKMSSVLFMELSTFVVLFCFLENQRLLIKQMLLFFYLFKLSVSLVFWSSNGIQKKLPKQEERNCLFYHLTFITSQQNTVLFLILLWSALQLSCNLTTFWKATLNVWTQCPIWLYCSLQYGPDTCHMHTHCKIDCFNALYFMFVHTISSSLSSSPAVDSRIEYYSTRGHIAALFFFL